MSKNKILNKNITIHQRQTIDLILWWAIISDFALLMYTMNVSSFFSYPSFILLILLFYIMGINNKIALEDIKKKKEDDKNEHR